MARTESKAIMGYLPIEAKHHAAIVSLLAPATPAHRILDPFAGQAAMLVRKVRGAGGLDVLAIDLDVDAWTRLITGGLAQGVIQLSHG